MIVVNFFHIKASNGLFFYGLDYAREQRSRLRKVLVRPTLAAATRRELPECEIVVCSRWRFLREAWQTSRRGDFLFTPTSHPLPGLSRQWIVVHDAYPFVGNGKGALKRALLRCSLALSRCAVAYINRADAQPFVAGLGVGADRQVFAPNRFPRAMPARTRARDPNARMEVGLVGSDSAKKNYAQLFTALGGTDAPLSFRVYGHDSAYFREVREQFPAVRMTLISSDQHSLEQFFDDLDVVASAATQEGFGRPIAAALLAGIPCVLVDCGVFREFFDDAAVFAPDAVGVARVLVQAARVPLAKPSYAPPEDALHAWLSANERLGRFGDALPAARR